ncbi:MAG: hypothetical protein Q4E12_00415 [Coriobacteriia bacterium]|nr:hypothetical protein [Coriobacteriia bacterium]
MDQTPNNEMPGAPAGAPAPFEAAQPQPGTPVSQPGAVPELHVSAGGKEKPRPSVANKRRAQATVPPAGGESVANVQPQPDAQTPANNVIPNGAGPSGPAESRNLPRDGATPATPTALAPDDAPANPDIPATPGPARKSVADKRKKGPAFVVLIVLLVLALLAAAVCGAFACVRWVFPQDAADLQGTWVLQGAQTPITITDSQIDLAGEAQFDYQLDTTAKTITSTFLGAQGQNHYRFSRDRTTVAIIDGADCAWDATLWADLQWMWADFWNSTQDIASDPLSGEAGIVLVKVS